jgi:putative SOS response-associated peptidase YedK
MCGRYVTISQVQAVEKRFNVHVSSDVAVEWKSNANVSHGERAPVIAHDAPGAVQLFQFGLTPRWAQKQFYMVNARSEGDHNPDDDPRYTGAMGILNKPMFRQSIRERRCLVIADAFIEGPKEERLKRPYVLYPKHGETPFALAGIWDEWADPASGEVIRSFAIITTVANRILQRIGHHRSPVVIDPEQERTWMDPNTPLAEATAMLRPIPDQWLNAYPIDSAIRDPRANGSYLLEPTGERLLPEYQFSLHEHLECFGMGESRAKNRRKDSTPPEPPPTLF